MEKYCFSSKRLILIIVDINPCCAELFYYLIVKKRFLIVAQLTIISLLYNVAPRLGTRETSVNPDPHNAFES